VRYVFFSAGGHVVHGEAATAPMRSKLASANRSRKSAGFNPNVDRLLGAVNVVLGKKDAVAIVQELAGGRHSPILWSNRQDGDGIAAMNALGVLTSRYDIYQDVMDPANFPRLRGIHPDWTTAAGPKDIIVDRQGPMDQGLGVEAKGRHDAQLWRHL